jgi:YidC/Oxa1 family membrane protein insertase
MERRVILALFLSFLVIYTYQMLFVTPAQKPASTAGPSETARMGGGETAAAAPPAPTPAAAEVTSPPTASAAVEVGESTERNITVETSTVTAVFTNRGARLKSWRLKRYLDQLGQPLDLVPTELAATHPLPFSLKLDDEALTSTVNRALFAVTTPGPAGVIETPARLTFEYRDDSDLSATKTFVLEPAGYIVSFESQVRRRGTPVAASLDWGPGLGHDGSSPSGQYAVQPRGLLLPVRETKTERIASGEVAEKGSHQGEFQYAGVDDHYFMSAVIDSGPVTVSFQPVTIPPPEPSGEARALMAYSIGPLPPAPMKLYVGPKDFDELSAVAPAMVRAIDFGIFDVVVVPLLRALKWIYGYVGNYGWAIILLTIAINALMFPLRHKSVVSMRKMQEIQPEAKKIQERYANLKSTDPAKQKMNQELMALYRERGVNPASGCVPMLLTFPVLFAFYALLTTAIELRGAPFVGWIRDLSVPDPLYVTPVLMGVTQIWQTRMTPQTGVDPAQQKMMMFMPVLFMFFFLWAPAGVVLYWLMSNVWGIGQQYLTNYLIGPPVIRPVRPAAERRVKQVGSGKTDAAAREG